MGERHAQRGQVLPLVAICLAVLMGFAGIAVDVGYWEYQQRQQQSATDAAAVGGAQQLLYAGCPNSAAATTAGQKDASESGFANGGKITVAIGNPSTIGTYAGQSCAVSAQITNTGVPTWFSRVFGRTSANTGITTQAVATLTANDNGCIYLLSGTSESTINGDNIQAPNCGILINDTAIFNGSTVNAYSIGYAGGAPVENGANFPKGAPQTMLPVADPCPEIAGCAYLAANPPSTSSCPAKTVNGGSATLMQGCYGNLVLNGASVTLDPGTYVFNGSTLFNGSTITGSGVTIYVTANGTPPDFNGNTVNLSPPTSGNENGVLYYQVPSNTAAPTFNGSSGSLAGLIYAPGALNAVFNGTSGSYLVLVFGSTIFNGASAYDFAGPPTGGSLIRTAVLVQ